LGDPKAPNTLVEYGDYQCPWCGRFANEVEPLLINTYVKTGKVKVIYRNFPFLGPESFAAAGAAECAKNQGKLWAYHDAIYREEDKDKVENNGNLNQDLFVRIAAEIGLDKTQFNTCLSSNKYQDKIKGEVDAARKVGVNGTPALFLNGTQIGGYIDFPTLDSQVKALSSQK
ncbi:MAG: thioredoxin domain-containing protein, partial [Patescibacteria group bacterium]